MQKIKVILLTVLLTILCSLPAFAGDWSVISSEAIHFSPEDYNNNYNAVYASQFINGKILQPGEQFSYNDTVGARSLSRGFVIGVNTVGAPDIGGGVCRESTIIFQAARLAGMDILERWNHEPHVDYATPGDDAAVQYGLYDMRFVNVYNVPVMIKTAGELTENGLCLWAVFLKEEQLPTIKVIVNNEESEGKLFNGVTYVSASKLANVYGKKLTLTENMGFHNIDIGGIAFLEEDGNILRCADNLYIPLRRFTDSFGGTVLWMPGASPTVALALPDNTMNSLAFQHTFTEICQASPETERRNPCSTF